MNKKSEINTFKINDIIYIYYCIDSFNYTKIRSGKSSPLPILEVKENCIRVEGGWYHYKQCELLDENLKADYFAKRLIETGEGENVIKTYSKD